jgi:hypothetical protein
MLSRANSRDYAGTRTLVSTLSALAGRVVDAFEQSLRGARPVATDGPDESQL